MKPNRRNWVKQLFFGVAAVCANPFRSLATGTEQVTGKFSGEIPTAPLQTDQPLKLGAFSMSLNVKDLDASKTFYENLGFKVFGGALKSNYLIMKNQNALIGLFHGMFQNNILTFNPGWDENATKQSSFDDVRKIQKHLKAKGIKLEAEADEKTTGPASIVFRDPDGNTILVDQHV